MINVALVLGGGGSVGMAYHAGVLRALGDVDITRESCDLVVGTSAGSAVGAHFAAGFSHAALEDILSEAEAAAVASGGPARPGGLAPIWRSPLDFGRRALGNVALAGALVAPDAIAARMPHSATAGLFRAGDIRRRITDDLPDEWPDQKLWCCTVDVASREPLVLGQEQPAPCTPAVAVAASSAVPFIYEPVRLDDGRLLVDGGVRSSANLDLVAEAGATMIICSVPMAYEPTAAPGSRARRMKQRWQDEIERQADAAEAIGAKVLLIRPTRHELTIHGSNPMRANRATAISAAAHNAVRNRLRSTDAAAILKRIGG